MCGIFGYVNYGENLNSDQINKIYLSLSKACNKRGDHASGIAYVQDGEVLIQKASSNILKANFSYPQTVTSLLGHCRLAINKNYNINKNNHPFIGRTLNKIPYALAHNGILADMRITRSKFTLPKSDIETDSFGAVQLLNTKQSVNFENLKFTCENLRGSYAFTMLDGRNNLFLCRGDVPIFLVHFATLKLYVYISTRDLFEDAIKGTNLNDIYQISNVEVKNSQASIVHICKGEIIKISPEGEVTRGNFNFCDEKAIKHNWYLHELIETSEFQKQIRNLNND